MLGRILHGDIAALIERRDLRGLRELIESLEPADVADILEDLPDDEVALVFRLAPRPLVAEVFAEMEPVDQETLLHRLPQEHAGELIASLDPDERTAVLDDLPPEVTRRLMTSLTPAEFATARKLLAYPENSVGRLMTPEVLALPRNLTAAEALERLRRCTFSEEALGVLYLVNESGRLAGALSLPELVRAPAESPLDEVESNRDPAALSPAADQDKAIRLARKYNLVAVPVVDEDGFLLGAVTVDDILEVHEEKTTKDIHRLGGVVGANPELRYFDRPVLDHLRSRAPWVVVLALFGIVSGEIIAHFEDFIRNYVLLVVFMPMLVGTGGNVGTQAATVVIRALALGEVRVAFADLRRILTRELLISLGIGFGVAIVVFGRVLLYAAHNGAAPPVPHPIPYIGLTIAIAMTLQVVSATLFGAAAPFIARSLRFDPAVVASPAIATFVDITGLIIYFGTARWMLG